MGNKKESRYMEDETVAGNSYKNSEPEGSSEISEAPKPRKASEISEAPKRKEALEISEEAFVQKWENLTICNDFIFGKVMQDKELLLELIRRILPDMDITDLSITAQKEVDVGKDIHGVRFDIFAFDNLGRGIEVEMQVADQKNLPKRIRYYTSMADSMMLEKGILYKKLKDTYIIIICTFDYYNAELYKYTFSNRCKEISGLEMGDGTTKIVLNAKGKKGKISEKLKAFLRYVCGEHPEDDFIDKIDLTIWELYIY